MWASRDEDSNLVWLWQTEPKRRGYVFGIANKAIGRLYADNLENPPAPGEFIEIERIKLVAKLAETRMTPRRKPTKRRIGRGITRAE